MTIKSSGTKTWRNNNVGNLKYFKKGSFANRNGSIGVANQMALFPDIETGRKALIKSLKGPSCYVVEHPVTRSTPQLDPAVPYLGNGLRTVILHLGSMLK